MSRATPARLGTIVGALGRSAVAVLALAGCASSPGLESSSPDLTRFRQDVASLERTAEAGRALAEQRLARIETGLRREFDSTSRQSEDSRALLNQRLQELLTEFRIVQGKLEENTLLLTKLERRMDALQARVQKSSGEVDGLAQRLQRVEEARREPPSVSVAPARDPAAAPAGDQQRPSATPSASPRPAAPAPGQGRSAGAPSLPPEEMYKQALGDYNRGDYDFAIAGFRTYLRSYPGSSLASSAQYMIGESYFGLKNYVQAIEEFSALLQAHPDDPAAPGALLKQGEAHLRLEDRAQGNRAFCALIARFPNSREARLARDRNPRCG